MLEPLEARIAPATVVSFNSTTHLLSVQGDYVDDGSMTVQAGAEEMLSFSVSGGVLSIVDTAGHHVTAAGTGLTQSSTTAVTIPVASLMGDIMIELGSGATDTLTFANSLSLAADHNFTAHAAGTISLPGGQIAASGMGAISLASDRDIVLSSASLSVENGTLTLQANAAGTHTDSFLGLDLNASTVTSTGTGDISIIAHGGNGVGQVNVGIWLHSGSTIAGGTGGSVSVTGIAGAGTSSAANGVGVIVEGFGSDSITSQGANIVVTGTGGSSSTHDNVGILANGTISAGGAGSVSLIGTGGSGGNLSHGLQIGGVIQTGSGNIMLMGAGGTTGTANYGIILDGSGGHGLVQSATGTVSLTGLAGAGSSDGLMVANGAAITSAGDISLTGQGNATDASNAAMELTGATISSTAGNIHLTASTPTAPGTTDLNVSGTTVTAAGTLTIIADSMNLSTTDATFAAGGVVTLKPFTPGVQIDLGSTVDNPDGPLALSDAELARFTGSTLQIGDVNTGAMNISASMHSANPLTLMTGAAFTVSAPLLAGGNLAVFADSISVNQAVTAGNISFYANNGVTLSGVSAIVTATGGGGGAGGGEAIDQAGADYTTHDAWRTSSVAKPIDPDGDNIYGTAGYYLFGGGSSQRTVVPSFATVSTAPGTGVFGGNGGYANLDDPAFTGIGPVPDVMSGIVYQGGQAANQEGDFVTITITQSGSFRLGVITDNTDFAAISPLSLHLRQTTGGTADSGYESAAADRNQSGDYYFFDVENAKAGDVFVLSGVNDGGHPSNGVYGVTFDQLPGSYTVNADADGNGTGSYTHTGGASVTAGNATIHAADVSLAGPLNAGAGKVTLAPSVPGGQINVGTHGAGQFGVTNADLAAITAGQLQIGDNNSGALTVSATISHLSATALTLTTGAGQYINFNAGITTAGGALSFTNNVALGADVTLDTTNAGAFAAGAGISFGGTINLGNSTLTHDAGATATFITNTINGSGGLTKLGSGTLSISGSAQYSGATTVSAGKVTLINEALGSTTASIASGATLEYALAGGDVTQPGITFSGTGTLLKSGPNRINFGGGGTVNFQLGAGALIDVEGGSFRGGYFAQDVWTNNLSDLNIASGATFVGTEANVRVDKLTGSGTLTTGFGGSGYVSFTVGVNNGSSTFDGPITDDEGGGSLTKEGTGTITLSAPLSYTGGTSVNAGKLVFQNSTYTNSEYIASGAILNYDIASGTENNQNSTTLTGTGTLLKTGAGGMIWEDFIATFAFSPGALIDVEEGTLIAGRVGNYNWGTNHSDLNVAPGATFYGNNADVRVNAVAGGGEIQAGYFSAGSFTFGVDNASSTFAGTFFSSGSDMGKFTKTGTGTITLTGASSFDNKLTIDAGTLALANSATNNPLASVPAIEIHPGAALDVTGLGSGANAHTFLVSAAQSFAGPGTVIGNLGGSGSISPDYGAGGVMTITGDFKPTGQVYLNVFRQDTPGVDFDQFVVGGNVDLSGATLNIGNGAQFALTKNIPLIENQSGTATVAAGNLAEGVAFNLGGSNYNLHYNAGDGNDVELVASSFTANLAGGTLTLADTSAGSDDVITVGRAGGNLVITNTGETFGVAPAGGTLTDGGHTLTISLASIASGLVFNTGGGNDSLTLDFTGGNFIPAGGISYDGGTHTTADTLTIHSGSEGDVSYTENDSQSGTIAMSGLGTVQYAGVQAILNDGSTGNVTIHLPTGGNAVTLGDDGTSGNALSRLSGATISQIDFANPANSLTLIPGSAADTLTLAALPDFTSALTLGQGMAALQAVNVTGNFIFQPGFDFTVFAGSITTQPGTHLTTHGSGNINFHADVMDIEGGLDVENTIFLNTLTPGTAINLGSTGDSAPHTLELSNNEIQHLSRAILSIGDGTDGLLTVSNAIQYVGYFHVTGGTGVDFTPTGSLDDGGYFLYLGSGGSITAEGTGTQIQNGSVYINAQGPVGTAALPLNVHSSNLHADTSAANGDQFFSGQTNPQQMNAGTGTIHFVSGDFTADSDFQIAAVSSLEIDGATYHTAGTHQSVHKLTLVSGNIVDAGVITAATDFDLQGGSIFAGLDGAVGLVKSSAASVHLEGNNTFTGLTTISGGTLYVDSNVADVAVNAGGTLAGLGKINGSLSGTGTVAPGDAAVGILTVTGNFAPSGTLIFDVHGPYAVAGTDYDQIIVNGSVDLSQATITILGGEAAYDGTHNPILISKTSTSPMVSGTHPSEHTTINIGAATFALTYFGGDGNDLGLHTIAPGLNDALTGGNLTISDNGSALLPGHSLTLAFSGGNLLITDASLGFGSAPAGATLTNNGLTLVVPLSLVTGSLTFDTGGGDDTLTLDLTGGNVFPTGGITYLGGGQVSVGDKLVILGGSQGTVTYTALNAHDGSVAMSNFGTVSYQGLEPIVNTGSATDIVFHLPTGGTAATLGDDAIAGNGLSRLSGATFEQVDFANPSNSLTILRGDASDSVNLTALPDFDANLALGATANPLGVITFNGALTLSSGHNLSGFASGAIKFGAPADLALNGSASLALQTAGSLFAGPGAFVKLVDGNLALIAGAGIELQSANFTASGTGSMTLTGHGGASGTGVLIHNSSTLSAATGDVSIIADSLTVTDPLSTGGRLLIAPDAAHASIDLAGTGSAGVLELRSGLLAQLSASSLQIGNFTSGAITIGSAISLASNLTLIAPGGISGSGDISLSPGKNLSLTSSGDINLTGNINAPGLDLFEAGSNLTLSNTSNHFGAVGILGAGTAFLAAGSDFQLEGAHTFTNLVLQSDFAIVQTGTIIGTGGLTKLGAGTLTLTLTNSYSGGTTLSAGTIDFSNPQAFGTGAITVNDASTGAQNTALLASAQFGDGLFTNAIVVANLGTGVTTLGSEFIPAGGPSYFSNSITLQKTTVLQAGSTGMTDFDGRISGLAGVIKVTGGHTLGLGAVSLANTFSGDLQITGPGTTLMLNSLGDAIPDSSNVDIGIGAMLLLAKPNTSGESINALTGAGIVEATVPNTLTIGAGGGTGTFGGLLLDATGTLSIAKMGAGTETLTGANTFTGNTQINGGTLTLGTQYALISSTAVVGASGHLGFASGIPDFQLYGLGGTGQISLNDTAGNPITLHLAGTAAHTFGGVLQGSGSLSIDGGQETLTNANTYTGATVLNSGLLMLDHASAVGSSTIQTAGGGLLAFANGIGKFTIGGLSGTGGFNLSSLDLQPVSLLVGGNNASTTFSGTLTGPGSLAKIGTGSLALTGENTFSGPTSLTGGTLIAGHALALENTTLTVGKTGQVQFAGNIGVFTLGGLTGNGSLVLTDASAQPVDLHVGQSGVATTFSGALSGTGTLTKIGSGTLTLTGKNSQTGGVLIQSGVLAAGSDTALGAAGVPLVINGGTLHATADLKTTRPITLQGDGTFEASKGAQLTLAGVISGSGALNIDGAGDVQVTNKNNVNTGPQDLDSDYSVIVNGVSISVPGAKGQVKVTPGPDPTQIAQIDLSGSTAKSTTLKIVSHAGTITTVNQIVSDNANSVIGAIVLGKNVVLGNGMDDGIPDLVVAGTVKKVQLDQVSAYALIELGTGLTAAQSAKNNPAFTAGTISGPGVVIDASGGGTGAGGGLGKVTVGSWDDAGTLKTSGSLKSFTLKKGTVFNSEIIVGNPAPSSQLFHTSSLTTTSPAPASLGTVSIPQGNWVGGGMQVQGVVAKLLTAGLNDGTTLSAGAFGAITINGTYSGNIIATADPSVTAVVKGKPHIVATGAIASVKVAGDFIGLISADGNVGNVTVTGTGRFEGSLHGANLGNITASSFVGDSVAAFQSITAAGSIGNITASVGGMTAYIIAAGANLGHDAAFGGGDDSFTSAHLNAVGKMAAVQVGNITVAGAVSGTTIVAGVAPSATDPGAMPIYGEIGDQVIPLPSGVAGTTKIGALKFEMKGSASAVLDASASSPVDNAIEAQSLTSIQFGNLKTSLYKNFSVNQYIDDGATATIVRQLVAG